MGEAFSCRSCRYLLTLRLPPRKAAVIELLFTTVCSSCVVKLDGEPSAVTYATTPLAQQSKYSDGKHDVSILMSQMYVCKNNYLHYNIQRSYWLTND